MRCFSYQEHHGLKLNTAFVPSVVPDPPGGGGGGRVWL